MASTPASEALRAFGVPHGDLTQLMGGASTTAWKIEAIGHSYVMRRQENTRYPLLHVVSELAWLDDLGQNASLRTPIPLRRFHGELAPVIERGPDGEDLAFWTMLHWVEGETLDRLPDIQEAQSIGAMMASLHRRAKEWTPPSGFSRPTYNAAHFARATNRLLAHAATQLTEGMHDDLRSAISLGTQLLEVLAQDTGQFGLIHADVHGGNVVYGGDPRTASPIDFERCGFGCWVLDVAMAMHYLTDELASSLLDGYIMHGSLTHEAIRTLPFLRLLAAIDNLAFLSSLPEEAAFIASELPALVDRARRLLN